jgi:hypothetical protein
MRIPKNFCTRHRPRLVREKLRLPSVAHFVEPTFADAILDRIVHNAYRLELDGPSMRKLQANAPARPGGSTGTSRLLTTGTASRRA